MTNGIRCRLNDPRMNSIRKNESVYHAVLIDLVLMGALDKASVEAWLGYEIPEYIKQPPHLNKPVAQPVPQYAATDDDVSDDIEADAE